jgi:hypothetical protein
LYKLHIRTPISYAAKVHPTRGVSYHTLQNIRSNIGTADFATIGRWKTVSRNQIDDFEKILDNLKGKHAEFKVRCECYCLAIYTNNLEILENICKDTSVNTVCVLWKPVPGSENYLTQNVDTIVSRKPVHYEYKVTMKYGASAVHKAALAAWIKNNPDKAKAGSVVLRSLEIDQYVGGNYFYVKNTSCLSIIEMMVGSGISKIEKVVHINDIDK